MTDRPRAESPFDLLPELDEPPANGIFLDWEEQRLEEQLASDQEMIEGNAMGEAIDPDDDEDTGL